jgi:hypothetical protein
MVLPRERPAVLVVGGWSPGPLLYLSSVLTSYQIVQPRRLPMPPFPGVWCCHPKVVSVILACAILLWLSCQPNIIVVWKLIAIVATLLMIRGLAAVAVRTSIETAANSCLEAIRPYNGNVVLIGFSWGGAVGSTCTLTCTIQSIRATPDPHRSLRERSPNRSLQTCWLRESSMPIRVLC